MTVEPKVYIRNFHLDDIKRILEIENASFTIDTFSEDMFRRWYKKCSHLFIVAEFVGIIIGYMITCTSSNQGEVVSIAVDPGYRLRGVGKTLVDFTLNKLKESHIIQLELEVRKSNIGSIKFWESLGFFSKKIVLQFYRDGEDAIKMWKLLGDDK